MEQHGKIGATVADRSLAMVTALTAEVAVLRERLAILEQIAGERGMLTGAEIDAYRPDPQTAAQFKAARLGLIQRVFGAMRA